MSTKTSDSMLLDKLKLSPNKIQIQSHLQFVCGKNLLFLWKSKQSIYFQT